jgi:hypothetical protein
MGSERTLQITTTTHTYPIHLWQIIVGGMTQYFSISWWPRKRSIWYQCHIAFHIYFPLSLSYPTEKWEWLKGYGFDLHFCCYLICPTFANVFSPSFISLSFLILFSHYITLVGIGDLLPLTIGKYINNRYELS